MRGQLLGIALFLALALPATGCSDDPALESLQRSFQTFVSAIETGDAAALWSVTNASFRQFCEKLQRDLAESERMVRLHFPEWEHERLLQRLAWHRLGGAEDGEELFARLIDFSRARSGDAVRAGLEHDQPMIQGNRATILTKARERFSFVLEEDGVWRTDIYERARSLPLIETLEENMATLRSNVEHLRRMYRKGTDPRTPEGAFNQFRQAMSSADGAVLEQILDDEARVAIEEIRQALIALQARAAKEVERRLAELELPNIDLAEAARSPRGLLRQLARSSTLGLLLGIGEESVIHVVRIESRREASVVTTAAEEFPLARDDQGLWRLSELAELFREGLLVPLGR